jgi:demethylmenaquinone methyltransferase/2-methoxy-6-polyprenyl-1,4-benzoquinol methylase
MIPTPPDERRVRAMFDSVASRYDLLNDLLSFGLDRRWRRAAARAVAVRPGDVALDLGCGTGKLGGILGRRCRVVGVDLSPEMLKLARQAAPNSFVQASAFKLPFRSGAFSAAVSGFLLRNLHDLHAAFEELARVVSPGGGVALLDITEPANPTLRRVFDAYFARAAPALGALAGNAQAYRYLVRSLAQLPPADEVLALLRAAEFRDQKARPLTGVRR